MLKGIYDRITIREKKKEKQHLNRSLAQMGKELLPETRQKIGEAVKKHGCYQTKLYGVWQALKQRCLNPNHKSYHRYGGRGILLYPEWFDFVDFRDWALINGYKEGLSIDRVNNNGDYEPRNCQWITRNENSSKDYKIPVRRR